MEHAGAPFGWSAIYSNAIDIVFLQVTLTSVL